MNKMQEHKNFVEKIISTQEYIRNVSIIAHIDHGKTTLCDNFIKHANISNKERYIDSVRDDQIERIITIKATGITLAFDVGDQYCPKINNNQMLMSLVDSPGHREFNAEVTSALRLTDGALVIVDCVSGIAVQTETVLKQAIEERVTPVLFLNKLDRIFLELKQNAEDFYQDLKNTIDRTNFLIQSFTPEGTEPVLLDPIKGNVGFGAGKQGWAFTLLQFAQIYSKNTNVDKMLKYLWGDWFYDSKCKKWRTSSIFEGRKLERGFVRFILNPLYKLCKLCHEPDILSSKNWSEIEKIVSVFMIPNEKSIKPDHSIQPGKDLMQFIFNRILPAAESVLSMIYTHIPSPILAQAKRAVHLYTGPLDDPVATAISKCDKDGPMILFITKMVSFNNTFLAYGRILSGTLTDGQKITILGSNYIPNKTPVKDCWRGVPIKGIKLSLAKDFIPVSSAKCGTIICIGGMEKYIDKTATLTSYTEEPLYPIKSMKFAVAPVVRVAVSAKNISDLPKLKDGLSILAKSSSMVEISFDETTKQFIVEGAGELHIEILIKDLKEFSNCDLKISEPVVPFRETVSTVSPICLVKSANKLNRIYCNAEPLSSELLKDIQEGKLTELMNDSKALSRYLVQNHGWNATDSRKIWCFGPEGKDKPTNILVDQTKSAEYLNEIKDSIISSFQTICSNGVLCGEPLTGIRFNIHDVKIHPDNSHRGSNQIIPAANRLFKACQLLAQPRLVEPVYLASLRMPTNMIGSVYQYIGNKRTQFIDEKHENNQVNLSVYLPVLESFGFDSGLSACSSGRCFPSLNFSHWQTLDSDPTIDKTVSNILVTATRIRKGLKNELPDINTLIDKL